MLISNNSTRIHCWHYPHHWQHHSHQTQPAESLSKTPGRAIYTVIYSPSTIFISAWTSYAHRHTPATTDLELVVDGFKLEGQLVESAVQLWLLKDLQQVQPLVQENNTHVSMQTFHCFAKPWIEILALHWTLHFALGAGLVWSGLQGGYERYHGIVCASAGVLSLLDFKVFY